MDNLKIGYIVDEVCSLNIVNLILKSKYNIEFIITLNEKNTNYEQSGKIPVIHCEPCNSSKLIKEIEKFKCDYLVCFSLNNEIPKEIIKKYKPINCHFGNLPFYRGRNPLNWALINDEKEFGITVHYIDDGINTGDIILQKLYKIDDSDDYSTLLKKAEESAVYLSDEAVNILNSGNIIPVNQKSLHKTGMKCCNFKYGDEIINWNQSSREVFNFIRGLSKPYIMARTSLWDKPLYVNKSKLIEDAPVYKGFAGEVLDKDDFSFVVKTKESVIKVVEYTYNGEIKVGDRLG